MFCLQHKIWCGFTQSINLDYENLGLILFFFSDFLGSMYAYQQSSASIVFSNINHTSLLLYGTY